jgi:tetratricopeptide (TPR) repeat protein
MSRLLLLPCRLGTLIRRRPKTTSFAVLLLLAAGCAGGYFYALGQWHAAQEDVREGRYAEARDRLTLCLRLWPRSSDVHLLAARLERLDGHMDEADAHLKVCMKLQGGATEATQLEYLLIRAQTGEEEEVAPDLFRFVDHNHPDTPWIMSALCGAYMRHLRFGPAYAALTRWMEVEPGSPRPYHWRGWVLEHLNNPYLALKDYEHALKLDPDLFAVRLRVAEIYMEQHRQMNAVPHLEWLHRQFPERADVLARLGECRLLEGRTKEGRRLLQQALKQLPEDVPVLANLAELELLEGRPAAAENWLRKALRVDPADTKVLFALYRSLQQQGRAQEAATVLASCKKESEQLTRTNLLLRDEARQPSPDPAPASEIGIALLRIGQDRQGLYWLEKALQRDPNHVPSHRALADYFERKGDHEAAAAHRRWLNAPLAKATKR